MTPEFESEVEKKLNEKAACRCCERHQINKPTKFVPWVELPFHGTQYTPCECSCRHDARIICRRHKKCQSLISKEPAMKRKFGDIMEWYEDDLEGWWEAMGEQAPDP